jgi:hypothetical protein
VANTNAPFGFRQYSGTGSAPTYEQVEYTAVYNASAIFFGDPVQSDGAGGVQKAANSGASANAEILGIFVGCKYLSVSQKRTVWSNYWPGSDVASGNSVSVYVVNDPNAKFVVQTGSAGLPASNINNCYGFNLGTGNTANGISGAYLTTTAITDGTAPFRMVGVVTNPPGSAGTDVTSGYNWVIVAFNDVSTRVTT